jgi:hypothetical protein
METINDRKLIIQHIPDNDAIWEKHFSQNSWSLLRKHFELAGYKGRRYDGTITDIYGWVEEITWGNNIGKFKAGHPKPYDGENDSDAIELGIYDTVEEGKAAVLKSNMPPYGYYC